jgi:sulfoxide reductase heme-binding subunit YedZ
VIWPWQDRKHGFSWLKAITFALMFAPGLWLSYRYASGALGRLPIAGLTYWSGVLATQVLLLALAVTPAMVILRWSRLLLVRRMVGVTTLFYTVAHIIIYFALRFWDFGAIALEMATRISLIIALAATAGLVALTATSLDSAVRRMGPRWQRLHNWVYVFAGLALVHFVLSPDVYAMQYLLSGIFFWLMMWRVLNRYGRGTDVAMLLLLAVASGLFAALFEAGWTWVYQEFDPVDTLNNNFSLDLGLSPAWEVLALGCVAALLAALRRAPRLETA